MERKIKTIIASFLILCISILSGCKEWAKEQGSGAATVTPCPQYGCKLTTREASFESKVLDDSGNGCLTDCNADVYIKNTENQPVMVYVQAGCYTVNKRVKYSSETYWLQPGGEHTFNIKVDSGLTENWRCENFEVHSEKISDCEVYQIN